MAPKVQIRPATEADVATIVDIHNDSFGPGLMNRLMHPNGASAESDTKFGESVLKQIRNPPSRETGDEQIWLAYLPEENDEVIAFAMWTIFREERPEEEWSKVASLGEPGPEVNVPFYEEFLGGLHRMRKRWMKGDKGLLLRMLCCKTARHRLGAGSALLRWGCELADREGLVTWLEASPEGYGAYRKFGFEPVEVQDLKVVEKWGAVKKPGENWGEKSAVDFAGELPEGIFRNVMMRRLPVKA